MKSRPETAPRILPIVTLAIVVVVALGGVAL